MDHLFQEETSGGQRIVSRLMLFYPCKIIHFSKVLRSWYGNMRHETWNMRHEIWDMRLVTWDMRHETWEMRHETWDMRHETWDMRHEIWDIRHEVCSMRHETCDIKHESYMFTSTNIWFIDLYFLKGSIGF